MARRVLLLLPLLLLAAGGARALNLDCELVVPLDPLSAVGLATPYLLRARNATQGPCHMANAAQRAFVEGVVVDVDTAQLYVYNPLVIDEGSMPAAFPLVPALPRNYVAALFFGFNGQSLRLVGTPLGDGYDSLFQGACLQGVLTGSMPDYFGRFAYCNALAFFARVRSLIDAGRLVVPPLGRETDNLYCPSIRDFSVVDATQSDGVVTSYLLTQTGRVAQNTVTNQVELIRAGESWVIVTGTGDQGLLVKYVTPALGCRSWLVPDLANHGNLTAALALNEIQAAYFQAEPMAQVPGLNPMVLTNGTINTNKLSALRAGLAQSVVADILPLHEGDTVIYCEAMASVTTNRLHTSQRLYVGAPSPEPNKAVDLFSYMAARFVQSYADLQCQTLLNRTCPIVMVNNSLGVYTSATIQVLNIIEAGAFLGEPYCVTVGTASALGVTLLMLTLLDLVFLLIWCFGGNDALPVQSYHEARKKEKELELTQVGSA